jgi:hypothetical protein
MTLPLVGSSDAPFDLPGMTYSYNPEVFQWVAGKSTAHS